jgi:hypothetical protein
MCDVRDGHDPWDARDLKAEPNATRVRPPADVANVTDPGRR